MKIPYKILLLLMKGNMGDFSSELDNIQYGEDVNITFTKKRYPESKPLQFDRFMKNFPFPHIFEWIAIGVLGFLGEEGQTVKFTYANRKYTITGLVKK